MNIFQAIILGLVQGITEFLPVSSSGHLVFFQKILGVQGDVISFDIAVHLATLVAVFAVFWDDICMMVRRPFSKFPIYIVIATLPAIAFAIIFKDLIKELFETGRFLSLEFFMTGVIMLYAENKKCGYKRLADINIKDALFIGTAQAVAILPAVSRSGFTISGALVRGLDRRFAAKFSFILSIPAILGSAVFDIKDVADAEFKLSIGIIPLIAGMLAAGISGYFAIKYMLKVLREGDLKIFSYYVFGLAIIVLIDQLFFGVYFPKFF